jgi:hypothetical protein
MNEYYCQELLTTCVARHSEVIQICRSRKSGRIGAESRLVFTIRYNANVD